MADAAAALEVAKTIAKTISGSVTIADGSGNIIGKVCGHSTNRLAAAMRGMTVEDIRDLIDEMEATINRPSNAAN